MLSLNSRIVIVIYFLNANKSTLNIPLRSQITSSFDCKKNCFICGFPFSEKKRTSWSLVESSIEDDPKKPSIYSKDLGAAEDQQDQEMTRLHDIANSDLVAVDARYHRTKKYLLCHLKEHFMC